MGERMQLAPRQILVLCRGTEVIAGMGDTAEFFELLGYPQETRLWGIRLARLLMPAEVPLLEPGEAGLCLRLERVGSSCGELVAADLVFVGSASGFTAGRHDTFIYEVVDFETRTRPVILGRELGT